MDLPYKAEGLIATNKPIDFFTFSDHDQPRRACHSPRHRGRVGQRRRGYPQFLLRLYDPKQPRKADQFGIHRDDRR